jgi:hypothetical protein
VAGIFQDYGETLGVVRTAAGATKQEFRLLASD